MELPTWFKKTDLSEEQIRRKLDGGRGFIRLTPQEVRAKLKLQSLIEDSNNESEISYMLIEHKQMDDGTYKEIRRMKSNKLINLFSD